MSASTSKPYDWIKRIPRSLLELDDIPLFGYSKPFPWEELTKFIASDLGLQNLIIEEVDSEWREKNKLFENLGDDLLPLNFGISGFEGSICWVMPASELDFIITKLMNTENQEIDNEFEESFYRFLGYHVVTAIGKLNWDRNLSIHIFNKKEMPAEDSFCIDIRASWNGHTLYGRLILSPSFLKAWKQRFAERSLEFEALQSPLAEEVTTTLNLVAGHTTFTASEWAEVKPGDFILLNTCTITPEGKGSVTLTLKGQPFYSATLDKGILKIQNHPDTQEVDATMNDDLDEEFEDFDEDFDDEDFDEDEDLEDEEFDENIEDTASEDDTQAAEEVDTEVSEEAEEIQPAVLERDEKIVSPQELPMSLIVEVGRLKMSLKKVLELQPGNILDLNIKPEDGIDLTVNGKRVAKGELLRVGETLGVRILDIG